MQARWEKLLGGASLEGLTAAVQRSSTTIDTVRVERWLLTVESGIRIPCVLLQPEQANPQQPCVVAVCSQGKDHLLKERAGEIAILIERGAAVCLVDPRGIGESKLGDSHGRRSSATSHSSTELMLGGTLPSRQLRDVRLVLNWLRTRPNLPANRFALWGESLVPPNADDAPFRTPRDDDQSLPAPSEPQAPLLALLTGLFEDDVAAIYTAGGLVSWRALLDSYLVLAAHDSLVPGALTAGDIADLTMSQSPATRVRMEGLVDGWNRRATDVSRISLPTASKFVEWEAARHSSATWLVPAK
ncbi:MAG: hypothetical protein H7062_15200, partial [Candidatus Saccharimonas sp.]|nr:hypothetical protein [Planctomycetaceae bacterium]